MIPLEKALQTRKKSFEILSEHNICVTVLKETCIQKYDLKNIFDAAVGLDIKNILEIGSFVGVSTVALCAMFEQANIVCVDPNLSIKTDAEEYGCIADKTVGFYRNILVNEFGLNKRYSCFEGFFSNRPHEHTLAYHRENNPSIDTIKVLKDSGIIFPKFDLIFLDGDHYAESVYSDLKFAFPMLSDSGVIITHDICDDWGKEVRKGIDKFLQEYDAVFEEYNSIGVIKTII